MKITDISTIIEGTFLAPPNENDVKGVYCCDMLSRVMGGAKENNVWVTIQCHMNVIAVSSLMEIGCVVFAESVTPPEEMVAKAKEEGLALFVTDLPAYEICGRLYQSAKAQ